MIYLLYLFGFLPSIIWLFFYLRKDAHPESNRMILKIFFLGMLAAFFAIFLEKGFQLITSRPFLVIFFGGALIEEYLKYLVVKFGVFNNSEMDEPTDLLLYMIISALGFAALENILVLSNSHPLLTTREALGVIGARFVSATFLHALCSGTLGYFLALSFYHTRQRKILFFIGLSIATFLHGLYNWPIMTVKDVEKYIFPLFVLITLAYFVASYRFRTLPLKIFLLVCLSVLAFLHIIRYWSIIKIEGLLPLGVLITLSLFILFSFKKLKRLKSVCEI